MTTDDTMNKTCKDRWSNVIITKPEFAYCTANFYIAVTNLFLLELLNRHTRDEIVLPYYVLTSQSVNYSSIPN